MQRAPEKELFRLIEAELIRLFIDILILFPERRMGRDGSA